MLAHPNIQVREILQKPWLSYAFFVVVVLAILFGISKTAASLPAIVFALAWAVLALISSLGLSYHSIIKKTHNQFALKARGRMAKINGGRTFRIIISFVISAACTLSLLIEAPTLSILAWVFIAIAALGFPLLYKAVSHFAKKEFEAWKQTSFSILASTLILWLLLCIAFACVSYFSPSEHYENAAQAFVLAFNPFQDSTCVLLSEAGTLFSLTEAMSAYFTSKASSAPFALYLVWRIVLCASSYYAIATLIGSCAIPLSELKKIFLPLEEVKKSLVSARLSAPVSASIQTPVQASTSAPTSTQVPTSTSAHTSASAPTSAHTSASAPTPPSTPSKHLIKRRYVAVYALLPILLFASFFLADYEVSAASQGKEVNDAQNLVKECASVAAYCIDGSYYSKEGVDALLREATAKSDALKAQAKNDLVPLINSAYDQRVSNVDSYLDWYYSLTADYERLAQTFTGTIEEGMKDKLAEKLEENVDTTKLTNALESMSEQAQAIEDEFNESLQQYKLDNVDTWLITQQTIDESALDVAKEPSQKLLDFKERFVISGASGAAGGLIAGKIVSRSLEKGVLGKMTTRLVNALSVRGLTSAAGGVAGSAALGVGTVIGIAAGTVIGFATDYAILKADEAINRETYKQELVEVIEQERSETLAFFDE